MPLPARRYTFATLPYTCEVVVLDVEPDGRAFVQRTGLNEGEREPVLLERDDAEVFILPADGSDQIGVLDAASAVLRRTSCDRFAVTIVRGEGDVDGELAAAEPCFEFHDPPENGDEYDPCSFRYCEWDHC